MEITLKKYLTKTTHFHFLIWASLFLIFPKSIAAFSSDFFQLKVTVTDGKTGEPLIGVNVYTDDMGFTGSTDLDGKIKLEKIGHREVVHFSYLGYQTLSLPFHRIRELRGKVRLLEKVEQLAVIEVVGRRDDPESEIPYLFDKVSKESIAFSNSQTAADALGNNAEVYIQKSQMGGGSPIIRGFEANKVLLVLDGVRMNNAIYREGHIQNSITVDNSILEQAEVIYGPGSLIYGSDALGGVVHFRTRDPKVLFTEETPYELTTNAGLRFSTANLEKAVHLDFDYSTQNWGSITSISYVDYDDLRAGANRPSEYPNLGERKFYARRITIDGVKTDEWVENADPNIQRGTGYSQMDFMQKIKFQPSEELYFILNVQYSTSSNIPRYDMLTDTLSRAKELKWGDWYYGPQNRFLASFKTKILNKTALYDKATIIGAYQRIDEDRFKRKYAATHRTFNKEDLHVFSFTTDFDKALDVNNRRMISYGLDLSYNRVFSEAGNINLRSGALNYKEFTRYPSDFSTMTSAGAYLNYRWRSRDSTVSFTAGVRYSFVELFAKYKADDLIDWPETYVTDGITTKNSDVTYASGLTFNSRNGWQLHLLGATAFRSPNIDDFAKIRVKNGQVLVPNIELTPEKALNGEVTLGKTFGKNPESGKYKISATGFYTYLKDAIVRTDATFFGEPTLIAENDSKDVQKNVNANNAYVMGGSANVSFDFNKQWQLASSINYVKGRSFLDSLEQPLAHIPPVYGRASLRFKTDRVQFQGVVRFNGKKPLSEYGPEGSADNDDEAIPGVGTLGWTTYNFYTSFKVNDSITFNFAAENILDTHYRPFASGVSAAGRNFIFSLQGSF